MLLPKQVGIFNVCQIMGCLLKHLKIMDVKNVNGNNLRFQKRRFLEYLFIYITYTLHLTRFNYQCVVEYFLVPIYPSPIIRLLPHGPSGGNGARGEMADDILKK